MEHLKETLTPFWIILRVFNPKNYNCAQKPSICDYFPLLIYFLNLINDAININEAITIKRKENFLISITFITKNEQKTTKIAKKVYVFS